MATHVSDKLVTSKTESYDNGGVREERQEEKGEEVNMGCINEGADSLTDQGSGSQEATGHQDIYARPDLTKKVRRSDRERGQIGDTEDSGQLEVREKTEDKVVNIYESVADLISRDVIPRPQEDMMDNTAGSQPRGLLSTVGRRLKDAAPWILLLCVILLVGIIVLAVHYNKANKQWQIRHDNFVLEKNLLETNLTNLILERDNLQREVKQQEAAVKPCPNGWQKFGSSCYKRSTEETNWEESRQHCNQTGADLVIINSKEEQDFIRGLNCGRAVSRIGLKKTEGKWTWVDGTPLTPTGYWSSGRPDNNTDHNCVNYRHKEGDWMDVNCDDHFHDICEK